MGTLLMEDLGTELAHVLYSNDPGVRKMSLLLGHLLAQVWEQMVEEKILMNENQRALMTLHFEELNQIAREEENYKKISKTIIFIRALHQITQDVELKKIFISVVAPSLFAPLMYHWDAINPASAPVQFEELPPAQGEEPEPEPGEEGEEEGQFPKAPQPADFSGVDSSEQQPPSQVNRLDPAQQPPPPSAQSIRR